MIILKCKMCGGDLEFTEGSSVVECEYCGSKQTASTSRDAQLVNLLNRANHIRQNCDFDKAIEIYERILQNNDSDAEVYWALALCKYGIEYVVDPVSKKRVPTCHRASYTSFLADADYKSALEHADALQRKVYEEEAAYIDSVQKGILEISNKEDPFDVFICYKETDENGERTTDSMLAQDLYYQLSEEGFKVFFSRITLESKLGTAYEPYIFAALNSAKVMVVLGTKPEYFNAVWVRNEWSRYLSIMHDKKDRAIIPAYKDMDPYDLPEELSMFQSQDMSKLGFMQDLIRGIKKLSTDTYEKTGVKSERTARSEDGSNLGALLKRGSLALEDGEWDRAFEFYDQVLNMDAECAEAYLGQALSSMKASSTEEFVNIRFAATEEVGETEHFAQLPNIDSIMADLDAQLKANGILDGIEDYIIPPVSYYTHQEHREKQLEDERNFFATNKLLNKAIRFSSNGESDMINKLQDDIYRKMQERIEEAKVYDVEQKKAALVECEDKLRIVRERVDADIVKRSIQYEKAIKIYNNKPWIMSAHKIEEMFAQFGDYRDAKSICQEIRKSIEEDENENRIYRLRGEKLKIYGQFCELGMFDGWKKKELNDRIKEIDDEIEKLEKEKEKNNNNIHG